MKLDVVLEQRDGKWWARINGERRQCHELPDGSIQAPVQVHEMPEGVGEYFVGLAAEDADPISLLAEGGEYSPLR